MPKLIVQDGDAKRAFRLSKGRLTLGSADSNKLVLTSDGVADEHAVLTIREEAATIDALAAVEIDGEKVTGEGNAVPIGATIRIGGAAIALRADEEAAKPAAATKSAGARSGGRSGGSSSRRGGGSSSRGRSGGSSRGGSRARRDDADEERPGRRRAAKPSGRPAWMLPVVILFALLIVAVGIMMSKGSGNETALNQAIAEFNSGQYERAQNWIDQVKRASLPPGRYQEYDDIAEKIELQQQQAGIEQPRSRAMKWADTFLLRFVESYLSEDTRAKEAENGREDYTAAKMRTWFERYDEFGGLYPEWNTPAWRHSAVWDEKVGRIEAIREDFLTQVDPNSKVTDADMEWAVFYYTDPGAKKGNRFDKAMATLEKYKSNGGSGIQAEQYEATIKERADAFAVHFLDLAKKTYEVANNQSSDRVNRQHLTAVNNLLLVARYSGIPERANQALDVLEGILVQFRTEIMKSYVNAAQGGDDAAAEKVAYLERARPTFRSYIDEAREEIAAAEAAKAEED